jgi:hypothetical protein
MRKLLSTLMALKPDRMRMMLSFMMKTPMMNTCSETTNKIPHVKSIRNVNSPAKYPNQFLKMSWQSQLKKMKNQGL